MNSVDTQMLATEMGFENETRVLPITAIIPLKTIKPATKQTLKYRQIVASVRVIGLVECLVVSPNVKKPETYFLLDGLLRLEAAKELGWKEIECLVSTDDEAFTYNKRISRLGPVQEHNMIVKAVEKGVSEERIAEALNLDVTSIHRRFKMLDGVCQEAIDQLADKQCPMTVFEVLKRMKPVRQIEATELMVGQRNYSTPFVKTILAASPEDQLTERRRRTVKPDISREQIVRLEKELYTAQYRTKYVEETYGEDNLQLTIAKTYLAKLLKRPLIVEWLESHQPEYLAEFQEIAEITSLKAATSNQEA